jgi:hypothetical protein
LADKVFHGHAFVGVQNGWHGLHGLALRYGVNLYFGDADFV